jgi:threonine synthase
MMGKVVSLKCVVCGKEYDPKKVLYTCPGCGDDGLLDVLYDYEWMKRNLSRDAISSNPDYSVRRYLPILPLEEDLLPPLQIGWTPLYRSRKIGPGAGLKNLFIKDDGRNPSASFKDRASSVGIGKARELGQEIITAASTGNAASSLSCLAASVGIGTIIFVPKRAPKAKIAQLLIFGAAVLMVEGTYDNAFDLCLEATRTYGWYNRNTGFNPYLLEGKKTAALEIAEQLGWTAPDKVVTSVGDGCIIGGIWKGFHDLHTLGWIDKMPQLVGVQAEGSAAIKNAYEKGGPVEPVEAQTIADSISVDRPRAAGQALRGLRDTKGIMVTVSDDEILEAMRLLGRSEGVFGEPAGVTSLAGVLKLTREGRVSPDEKVVTIITGNGLKDVETAMKAVGQPTLIQNDPGDMKRTVSRLGLAPA